MTGLAFGDGQPIALPVDVVEGQRRHLAATKAVGHEQHQDGVVPLPARRAPIDATEHPFHLGPRDRARDAREPVDLRPLDRAAEVAPDDTLAVGESQEDAQHPTAIADRRLGQPCPGALGDEGAEDCRGQLLQTSDAEVVQVGLEAVQVMPVGANRGRPKTTLAFEVLEEPRHRVGKGDVTVPAAAALEAREDHPKHLLDRATELLGGRALVHGATAATTLPLCDSLGHVGIDVIGQILHRPSAPLVSELAEGDQERHPMPHGLGAIAAPGQPDDVVLDLLADP